MKQVLLFLCSWYHELINPFLRKKSNKLYNIELKAELNTKIVQKLSQYTYLISFEIIIFLRNYLWSLVTFNMKCVSEDAKFKVIQRSQKAKRLIPSALKSIQWQKEDKKEKKENRSWH